MKQAKHGDTVKVHYTGKLENGKEFASSHDGEPLKFKIGGGEKIKGFEEAIIGMMEGESKTVKVPPDKAFGLYRKEMLLNVERNKLSQDFKPKVGQSVQYRTEKNQRIELRVIDVEDSKITLDGNHPLAGKELTFNIQLIDIV